MARRAPAILSVAATSPDTIEVTWEVDSFFADSEEPEMVRIGLNSELFDELAGDETSVEIPVATIVALGVPVVVISVAFWWSGSPAEEHASAVSVPVGVNAGVGAGGVLPASKPVVTVLEVRPRTTLSDGYIKIAWESNNYNDGNIVWGPGSAPTAFRRSIRPVGEVYKGTFQTDRKLSPATMYFFRVEVRNTLHSPTWLSTTAVVRSAANTLSVRQFLEVSGRPVTTGLATVLDASRSVRKMLEG